MSKNHIEELQNNPPEDTAFRIYREGGMIIRFPSSKPYFIYTLREYKNKDDFFEITFSEIYDLLKEYREKKKDE